MNTGTTTAAQEWRGGWKTVLAAFIGFLSFSTMIASMSAFMGPLAEEFGWSRTLLSTGTGLSSIITALLAPFLGVLMDRYGSRRLALPGLFLSAVAVVAMATNTGSAAYWIFLWLFYAVGGLFVNTPVWTAAVAGIFNRSQGLALAVTLAGATAAHAIMPPLSVLLIGWFGWRMAFVWLGLGWGILSLVVCYLYFFDAHDRHRASAARGEQDGATDRPDFPGLGLAEAWRSPALWQIGISILIIMALTIGFLVHQIEILVETGVSREMAAGLAGMAGAMGIVGKLVTGALLDRYRGNLVGGLTMGSAAVAFALLMNDSPTSALIVAAMLVNGYTAGAKLHIASYLTVRYAGMRNFGKIYGMISSLVAIGSGVGPILAGGIYDMSGGYGPFLMGGAVALAFSSLLLLLLPRYPDWTARQRNVPAMA
ncbi:MAG: MFS transporter [Planctomycetales bacterium]|nr:MFS transporter [Planctomycetales bacterium]MCP5401259.1 MFS transporter [Novosphingobium sp.]